MHAPDRIAQLRCTPVNVPLAHPVHTASGTIGHAPLALLDLLTDSGVEGRSYIFTYTPLALKPTVQLIANLAALVEGQPLEPLSLARSLQARFRLLGDTGLVSMALAGIDMAAWDALARQQNLPLARLLGAAPTPLPAYFSQGLDGAKRGCELAEEALRRGFKMMKIKAGYATLQQDLHVIGEVQRALGSECALAIDYNQSLNRVEALRRGRALDGLGLAWIEEPLHCADDAGHAQLSATLHTPVQIGENWFGTMPMQASLRERACRLVMPDVMKIGGVSGWQRAAALAAAEGLPMSSHLFPEFSLQLLCATPTAHWVEYLDLAGPLLQSPTRIEGGMAMPAVTPGAGLEWDAAAVERWRVQ